jgi:hypothetical protein
VNHVAEVSSAAGSSQGMSGPSADSPPVVDVAIAVRLAATAVAAIAYRLVQPFATLVLQPPVLPERYWPQHGIDQLADRGERARRQGAQQASALLDDLVPLVVNVILERIDLTQIVVDRGNLMRIVDEVDFDSIIDRSPMDHIVQLVNEIMARVNLDPIMDRVDVNAIASRIDIKAIIMRVDFPLPTANS